jgi:hypothetical protein
MSTGGMEPRTCGLRDQVTVSEANEALADVDARLFDPDPKST